MVCLSLYVFSTNPCVAIFIHGGVVCSGKSSRVVESISIIGMLVGLMGLGQNKFAAELLYPISTNALVYA